MTWEESAGRLLIACLLGALVGFERQWHQRTAGLRTNILVSIGSAAFTVFGAIYLDGQSVPRIVAQIVSGIGFLGAGVIMRDGFTVQGLNTAATIWCSAGMGSFCGAGYNKEAFIFAFFIVVTNTVLRVFENYMAKLPIKNGDHDSIFVLEVHCEKNHQNHVRHILIEHIKQRKLSLKQIEIKNRDEEHLVIRAITKAKNVKDTTIQHIIEELTLDKHVLMSKWSHPWELGR